MSKPERDSLIEYLDTAEPIDEGWPQIARLPPRPLDHLFADWDEEDDVAPNRDGGQPPTAKKDVG